MFMTLWQKLKALLRAAFRLVRIRPRNITLIDESLWITVTRRYAFMRGLSAEESRRLRLIASDFLARKNIVGADEVVITDAMRVEIAAQACILVLELGVDSYDGWRDIIVYPSQFMPTREVVDAAGVVHTTRDTLAGEAWLGGPVVLSYEDVARAATHHAVAGFNVVIHEFAHKLDMQNGDANGFPPLHKGMSESAWQRDFKSAYLHFCALVDAADARTNIDGRFAIDSLPIDAYASENPAEFFAVMSEAFFELPDVVNTTYPAVYAQLRHFYRQHPLARMKI